MATKKAATSKKKTSTTSNSTAKKSVASKKSTTKPVVVEEEIVEIVETVETTSSDKKKTIGEKFAALKPGALIAEFLGTFVLAGAVIQLASNGLSGSIGIALVLTVLVIVLGVISGAHLNPAITIAQYVNRKIDGVKAVCYIVAQVLGAIAAFCVLYALWQNTLDAQIISSLTAQGITQDQIDAA
ncbi:MAG: aquaporin, partial [Candidatus Nomurabacteria bacterium]|nr:aquaporin [Candidatus Nomurabacteria bacterium]